MPGTPTSCASRLDGRTGLRPEYEEQIDTAAREAYRAKIERAAQEAAGGGDAVRDPDLVEARP